MFSKIIDNSGESLVETISATLVVVLAMIMLPGAIVASSRVDAMAEKQVELIEEVGNSNPDEIVGEDIGTLQVNVKVNGESSQARAVTVYRYGTETNGIYQFR